MDQDTLHRRIGASELHKKLTAWVDQEMKAGRMTMGDELWGASRRMINGLWYAANNDNPSKAMTEMIGEDGKAFDEARRKVNRMRDDGTT